MAKIITAQELLDALTTWHSCKSDRYHDNSQCTSGNDIEPENYRSGHGQQTPLWTVYALSAVRITCS